jgi:hypothetical protein
MPPPISPPATPGTERKMLSELIFFSNIFSKYLLKIATVRK